MRKEVPQRLSSIKTQIAILADDLKQLGQNERFLLDFDEYFIALDHLEFASNELDYLVDFSQQEL